MVVITVIISLHYREAKGPYIKYVVEGVERGWSTKYPK